MTYKIDSIVSKLFSPITVIYQDGSRQEFTNGKELSEASFDKQYRIENVTAKENNFEIEVAEIVHDYSEKEAAALFDGV